MANMLVFFSFELFESRSC